MSIKSSHYTTLMENVPGDTTLLTLKASIHVFILLKQYKSTFTDTAFKALLFYSSVFISILTFIPFFVYFKCSF